MDDIRYVARNIHNNLEHLVVPERKEILKIKQTNKQTSLGMSRGTGANQKSFRGPKWNNLSK